MRRLLDIASDQSAMGSILGITNVFSGLASMRISVIKDQVLSSKLYFAELFNIYSKIRVSHIFNYGREKQDHIIDKDLFIIITSEGGFSGDIDQKLISYMTSNYNKDSVDIVVIGHHGALQLAQSGIPFLRYFKMPFHDSNINVGPLVKIIKQYRQTTVYYQTYVTLMVQDIKKLDLHSAIMESSFNSVTKTADIINEQSYIFEPDVHSLIAHLESVMLEITLTETIFESKLAQYASRFRAMQGASERAEELAGNLSSEFNKTKRFINDERLKEVINGLRKTESLNKA